MGWTLLVRNLYPSNSSVVPEILSNLAGTVLGIFLAITFFISIFAVLQRNHVTIGLVILNWVLIADAVVVLVVGSILWFFSLRQRENYFEAYKASSNQTIVDIQDKVSCILICLI